MDAYVSGDAGEYEMAEATCSEWSSVAHATYSSLNDYAPFADETNRKVACTSTPGDDFKQVSHSGFPSMSFERSDVSHGLPK
jgi:hypothetical protein